MTVETEIPNPVAGVTARHARATGRRPLALLKVRVRQLRALLAGTALLLLATPLLAEEADDQGAPGAPVISVVTGVAADDLLNIRDSASAFGKTKARLPNGASVRNFGCDVINGYPWCRIEVIGNQQLVGFAPGRYLRAAKGQEKSEALADIADTEKNAPVTDAIKPSATDKAVATVVTPPAANPAPVHPSPAVPVDMMARFGGPSPNLTAAAPAASSVGAAMYDAYGLAFATAVHDDDVTGGVKTSPATGQQADTAGDATSGAMEAGTPAPGIPIPTPRPDRSDETAPKTTVALADPAPAAPVAAADTAFPVDAAPVAAAPADPAPTPAQLASAPANPAQAVSDPAPAPPPAPAPDTTQAAAAPAVAGVEMRKVAEAQPVAASASPPDATGDVPCARYVGQPMTRCQASVARKGDDAADVTVDWPDGGTRVISFRDGKPSGSNSRGEFRFTREGTLNMIRVGLSERFEITDALALND